MSDPRLLVVAAITFAAAWVFSKLAPRLDWIDPPTLERKLQLVAVPTVGGAALLVGLLFAPFGEVLGPREGPWGLALPASPLVRTVGLLAVFAAGTLDDRYRFSASRKLVLQIAALLPLAVQSSCSGAFLMVGLGIVALNALNTFDNADGAVLAVASVGFASAAAACLAACLGLLPLNLDASRAGRRAAGAPTIYLGDAGANVLALLIVFHPLAWPALWIPLLDIIRLSVLRKRLGSRPWIGDRRHLAHRLEARGLSRATVALLLALLTLPGGLGCALADQFPVAPFLGLFVGAAGFLAVLRWTPDPGPPRSDSCSSLRALE